jgi:hypothetical protein
VYRLHDLERKAKRQRVEADDDAALFNRDLKARPEKFGASPIFRDGPAGSARRGAFPSGHHCKSGLSALSSGVLWVAVKRMARIRRELLIRLVA